MYTVQRKSDGAFGASGYQISTDCVILPRHIEEVYNRVGDDLQGMDH